MLALGQPRHLKSLGNPADRIGGIESLDHHYEVDIRPPSRVAHVAPTPIVSVEPNRRIRVAIAMGFDSPAMRLASVDLQPELARHVLNRNPITHVFRVWNPWACKQ